MQRERHDDLSIRWDMGRDGRKSDRTSSSPHAVPIVNASVDGDTIVYHKDVNVGVAVALDWGLIVPVIKNADERNLLGLSRTVWAPRLGNPAST